MRKVAFSVIATGSLALFIGTGDAEASSYTVKSGDSLWKIANDNNLSVSDLKQFNNLTSDLILQNQVLQLASTNSPRSVQNEPTKKAEGGVYVVKAGDTLSAIARQYKTTVAAIQNLNGISDHMIYAGQSLKVSGTATPPPTATAPPSTPAASTSETYRVVSGDTLSGISQRHGISITQLMNWNNLTSSNIRVGQVLKVKNAGVANSSNQTTPPPSATTPAPGQGASGITQNIISTAMSLQGTPYVFGGSTTRGFDCSGFIHYVYSNAGVNVPRTNTVGLDARSYEVDKLRVGDLVFFKNTYQKGISHAGIYIGDNKFVHAGGDRVQVSSVNDSYWSKHFDSFKRFYVMD